MTYFLSVEWRQECFFSLILYKAHNFFKETFKNTLFDLIKLLMTFVCMILNNHIQVSPHDFYILTPYKYNACSTALAL